MKTKLLYTGNQSSLPLSKESSKKRKKFTHHSLLYGPRERMAENGPKSLNDQELLSLLLSSGGGCYTKKKLLSSSMPQEKTLPSSCQDIFVQKKTALKNLIVEQLSQELIEHFGSLHNILHASMSELMQFQGIGSVKAYRILATQEILRRVFVQRNEKKEKIRRINSSKEAYKIFYNLCLEEQEVVEALFLDAQYRLISRREIFRGTVNASVVSPREILKFALMSHAVYFLVGHNHPSQDPSPSKEDVQFTLHLKEASRHIGIPLLDHIIIAQDAFYSCFAKKIIHMV